MKIGQDCIWVTLCPSKTLALGKPHTLGKPVAHRCLDLEGQRGGTGDQATSTKALPSRAKQSNLPPGYFHTPGTSTPCSATPSARNGKQQSTAGRIINLSNEAAPAGLCPTQGSVCHPLPFPRSLVAPTSGQSSPSTVSTPWGQPWDVSHTCLAEEDI